MNTKKIAMASVLVAVGVVMSSFFIPIGPAKCFPVQHFINVLAAVLLGPAYAVMMAFATSCLRIMMGTGSLLAFPGSMCGALLSGLLYARFKNLGAAFVGEVVGTGVLGALIAYPVAALVLSKTVAIFGFVIPFGISTLVGASIAWVFMVFFMKVKPTI